MPVASRHTFVPIPVCDGQTDEQTQDDSIGLLRACIESRCKSKKIQKTDVVRRNGNDKSPRVSHMGGE